jgi:hypothetical protein
MGTKSIDLFVREFDLPWLPFRELPPGQQSALEILKDRLRRDPERRRRALHREGAVWPVCRIGGYTIDLDGWNIPAGSQQPDILSFEGTSAGRHEVFTVQYRGDFLVHFASGVELGNSFSAAV